ncbi:unnamed protein product [Nesidiocoris tenuis]|uniref:Hcy-binding domain-containing protein n=1 Tax=Nesidiocoris tenuis TaxID=355587 RepID=A0A6H5HMP9_9HEMI|nr:unnamed protein product [Nesidiocoris tenuis]
MERKPVLTTTEITTELELHVQEPIDGHPLWGSRFLVKDRAACLKAYQNLIRSGAGVLMTNTYQATPDAFVKHMGLTEREAADIFEDSVKICQQAIELEKKKGEVSICGAIGSLNALRGDGSEYSGEFCNTYSDQEYLDMHRPRVKALVDSGVDFLCFETLPCSKEALFLIGLLEEFPNVKAWISFFGRNTKEISNGEIFADVAVKCWEKGEDRLLAVGVNCLDPAWVTPLFKSLKAANPNIPFIAYPNSGEKYDTESKR